MAEFANNLCSCNTCSLIMCLLFKCFRLQRGELEEMKNNFHWPVWNHTGQIMMLRWCVCGTNSVISSWMLHCDVTESQGLSTERDEILTVSWEISSVFIASVIPHNLSLCLNPYVLFIHLCSSGMRQRHGLKPRFLFSFLFGFVGVSLNSC